MNDCHSDASPANNSDSDSACRIESDMKQERQHNNTLANANILWMNLNSCAFGCNLEVITGNVVKYNDGSWSLLGTLSQAMTVVTGVGTGGGGGDGSGASPQIILKCNVAPPLVAPQQTKVDYGLNSPQCWEPSYATGTWSLLETSSQALTVVAHYWERCHKQWQ